MHKFGAAFIFGGRSKDGVNCDVWSLDVEKTVSVVENPTKYNVKNLWREVRIPTGSGLESSKRALCRYGHTSVILDGTNILLFGGLAEEAYKSGSSSSQELSIMFDIQNSKVIRMTQHGKIPKNRHYHGMLASGVDTVILYGG